MSRQAEPVLRQNGGKIMAQAYVFLAEGFEEIEGLTVVDILRRADIQTEMIAIGEELQVTGSHGIKVTADRLFQLGELRDAELYVLPGGMPGTKHLMEHQGLSILLKQMDNAGKKLAAICAAPSVLGKLELLKGRKAVCYPGFEDKLTGATVLKDAVAVDGNVTTSRGMGTAIPFALSLVAQLKGEKAAKDLAKGIIYGI